MRRMFTLLLAFLVGCASTLHRRELSHEEVSSAPNEGILKAHLDDGSLLILRSWSVDSDAAILRGDGERLDVARRVVEVGPLSESLEQIALFEVDSFEAADWAVGIAAISVISGALTIACAANPKSCFGSCPTFYDGGHLVAEGFSSSFAPSLEAIDLDHLGTLSSRDGRVRLSMRNEAFETHYVRGVELLAAACPDGEELAATPASDLWRVRALAAPPIEALQANDGLEYFSLADSTDLATKEFLALDFGPVDRSPGSRHAILVDSRQSLLSTYLFYQGIAYLGSHYGRWLARLRGEIQASGAEGMAELLGGIELQLQRADSWQTIGTAVESGPLASDRKLLLLPDDWVPSREALRLRMTKGMWRLDRLELVELVAPASLQPLRLVDDGDERLAQLRDAERFLVTLPGDELVLEFEAPGFDAQYFLRSQGYYVEWMREAWLREENPAMAIAMLRQPAAMLRRLAPGYKQVESEMETIFWESRYAHP